MFNILHKDLVITKRKHLISILVSIIAISVLQFDTGDYSLLGLYMCLAGSFTSIVGQSCYTDDRGASTLWLTSLPIRVNQIIDSKYILALLSILEGFIIYFGIVFLYSVFNYNTLKIIGNLFPIIIGLHLVYCGVYLFLYYKYNYSVAQYSFAFIFLFFMFVKMVGSKKFFDLSYFNNYTFLYLIMIIGFLFFISSWWYVKKKVAVV